MNSFNNTGNQPGRLFLMAFIVILLIGSIAGGIGWWLMNADSNDDVHKPQKRTITAPVFLSLDPFTINIIEEGRPNRVLYIEITLRLTDEATRKRLHTFMPEVRSRLLMLLSKQRTDELATSSGKVQLMSEIKQVLRPALTLEEPEQILTDVLFTTFILR